MFVSLRWLAAPLLLGVLYVAVGEGVQGWLRLYVDAWHERARVGVALNGAEWLRIADAADAATQFWPWKSSLYLDVARVQQAAQGSSFRRSPDIGEAMLDAVDAAAAHGVASGERYVLEARGCLLVGDYEGARDAIAGLKAVSPHGRIYWQRLRRTLARLAPADPEAAAIADEVNVYYELWLLPAGMPARATPRLRRR